MIFVFLFVINSPSQFFSSSIPEKKTKYKQKIPDCKFWNRRSYDFIFIASTCCHGFCLKTGEESKTFTIQTKFMRRSKLLSCPGMTLQIQSLAVFLLMLLFIACKKHAYQRDLPGSVNLPRQCQPGRIFRTGDLG